MSFVRSAVEFERHEFLKLQDGHTIDAWKQTKALLLAKASELLSFEIWTTNLAQKNFQFQSPKMKLHEFVRVPMVSDWARFAVQISKDEAPTPLLISDTIADSRAFVYFGASIACPPRNFENSQHLSNSKQRASPEVVNNSGNKATSLVRIPFQFAYAEMLVGS